MGLIELVLERLFPEAPAPIAAVRPGRGAVIRGRVAARDLIDSPFGGERCVYYHFMLEEWRPPSVAYLPGIGGGTWNVAQQDEAITEFYVEDDTGRALIAPAGALVTYGGLTPRRLEDGRRVAEVCIVPGDLVEVSGVADEIQDLLDDRRGYREPAARVLIRAPDAGRLRIRLLGGV